MPGNMVQVMFMCVNGKKVINDMEFGKRKRSSMDFSNK